MIVSVHVKAQEPLGQLFVNGGKFLLSSWPLKGTYSIGQR